ncbi:MAG: hypothetical protein ACRD8U_03045 [Pyrinomonadaceae bacterium]
MVVFDTTTILLVIDPKARPPVEPGTTMPVPKCAERVEFLLKGLSEREVRVMVPTPVISEFLIKGGKNKDQFAQAFISSRNFVVGDFDIRAAIELAHLNDPDLQSGKPLDPVVTKAKIKFDRQVVAIAKVEGADTLYTDDTGLRDVALANGLRVVMTWYLSLPPEDPQGKLGLGV